MTNPGAEDNDADDHPDDPDGSHPDEHDLDWTSLTDDQDSDGKSERGDPSEAAADAPSQDSAASAPPAETEPGHRAGDGATPAEATQSGSAPEQPGPDEPSQHPQDPVQRAYLGQVDLYDIATWEPRSTVDAVAVSMTNTFRDSRTELLVSVALVIFITQMLIAAIFIAQEPLLALLTVFSVIPALALALYIWYDDPTAKEPFTLLAGTFILAALFASLAALANDFFFPAFEVGGVFGLIVFYFVIVGPVEEFVKWLAIRIYAFKSNAFRTVVDGAVYGAAAGLGFATVENLFYILMVYLETAPAGGTVQTQYAAAVAGQRAFVGPGHVIFSAWAGFYLGLAKFNPENKMPIIVKGLLIAAFIHALYNSLVTILPLTVLGFVSFIVVYHGFWFALLYQKISKYRALYRALEQPRLPAQ